MNSKCLQTAIVTITLTSSLAMAAASATETGSDQVESLLSEAHQRVASGDMDRAIETLKTVDRLTRGRSTDALLLLAIANNNVGEPKDAISHAERLLELRPDSTQAADAYFQIGLGQLKRAEPSGRSPWSSRKLRHAEEAFREAVRLDGPRVLEAKAHLGYVIVLRENQKPEPTTEGYEQGLALARERFEDGSPGLGLDLARYVLCGSTTCEPGPGPRASAPNGPQLAKKPDDGNSDQPVEPPKKLTSTYVPGMTYAKRRGIRGQLVVVATITEEGRLANIRIVDGLPFGLNELVVEDLKHWRFEPATQGGQPVAVGYRTTFNYR